ncbi:MAG: archaeosortase/exosortase family protein [Oscillatoriales cyanobacterium SM2_2_1]|nr:archaeosortase/exosortase family protein [Oscillatoriales cyanobacterium SM2_2_1]
MAVFSTKRFWLIALAAVLFVYLGRIETGPSLYLVVLSSAIIYGRYRSPKTGIFPQHTPRLTAFLLGSAGLTWVVYRSHQSVIPVGGDVLSGFYLLVAVPSYWLMAWGWGVCRQHWRELSLLAALAFPVRSLHTWTSLITWISTLDAKLSTYLLWYVGFQASRQDNFVLLPEGSVEVNFSCSSVDIVALVIKLVVLSYYLFVLTSTRRWAMLIGGVLVAFLVNGCRIALLAILVAQNNDAAFTFWHGAQGAELFVTGMMLAFGAIAFRLSRNEFNFDPFL